MPYPIAADARRLRVGPTVMATAMCWWWTGMLASCTSCLMPSPSRMEAGKPARVPCSTCAPTIFALTAGRQRTQRGCRFCPGLVRYDEVAAGEILHALRFTAPQTRRAYEWPARHYASSLTGVQYPPMGLRLRLKSGYDLSGFSPHVQTILRALQRYGMMLADNGSAWYISGVPDPRWDNDVLRQLKQVPGSAFEVVDVSVLMVDSDSGRTSSSRN